MDMSKIKIPRQHSILDFTDKDAVLFGFVEELLGYQILLQ